MSRDVLSYTKISVCASNSPIEFGVNQIGPTRHRQVQVTPSEFSYISWWRPSVLSSWLQGTLICALASTIAALEATLQLSKNHDGLVGIRQESSYSYLWRFIPAALFLGVASLVGLSLFKLKVLAPYQDIHYSSRKTLAALRSRHLFNPTIVDLYTSGVDRHWRVLSLAIANLLAFPLTMISSGLFQVQTFDTCVRRDFVPADAIRLMTDLEHPSMSGSVTMASKTIAAMFSWNASAPLWTSGDFVFPQLERDVRESYSLDYITNSTSSSTLTLTLPAWHSALPCEYVPEEERSVTVHHPSRNRRVHVGLSTPPSWEYIIRAAPFALERAQRTLL